MRQKRAAWRVVLGLLLGLLAAAVVYALCRWVAYDLQERLGDRFQYEIVNDVYSQVVEIPAEGLYQTLPVKAGERIYGVRLKFSTYGTLYRAGMVMVDAYNAEGKRVALSAANYETVFDDIFVDFAFGSAYIPQQDETIALHIYNAVAWEGPLGLWASEGVVPGMPLAREEARTPADATLAVQYITNDSGTWPGQLVNAITKPLALAAFAAVTLLVALPAPAAAVVAVLTLLLGSVFATVTPPLVGPDEYTHLAASYELASRWAGQTPADEAGNLLVRAADAPYFGTKSGEIGIFAYKTMLEQRSAGAGANLDPTLSEGSEAQAGQGSGSYLAQAVGILLARRQGVGFYNMLWYGRMTNLAAYAALAALALALVPQGLRGLFSAIALLPMPLQLAATLSPDATLLGMVLCFVALCLKLREQNAPQAKPWQLALLAVLMVCIAPSKAIYLPVIALVGIIPAARLLPGQVGRLPGQRGSWVKGGLLALSALVWGLINAKSLHYAARDMNFALLALGGAVLAVAVLVLGVVFIKIYKNPLWRRRFWLAVAVAAVAAVPAGMYVLAHMGGGLTPEQLVEGMQPNGESIYTYSFGYLCRNLPGTAKLLLRTLPEQSALWLQGLLGTTLGEPIVYRIDVSWLLAVGLLLALLAAALPVRDGAQLSLGKRCCAGVATIVIVVVAISFVVALGWTPINYQTLFGLQGRYWLPVLPLALLPLKMSRSITAARDLGRPAVLSISFLNLLVLLQGVGLYATWQLT